MNARFDTKQLFINYILFINAAGVNDTIFNEEKSAVDLIQFSVKYKSKYIRISQVTIFHKNE